MTNIQIPVYRSKTVGALFNDTPNLITKGQECVYFVLKRVFTFITGNQF